MATVTAIEVRRKSAISWVLIPDGVAANEIQEAWWRATRIGDNITFKSTNGAVEFKDINYQFISYVDEVTPANNMASFASGYECFNYLKEQGFFDVGSDGGVTGSTFIGLDDTPSTYLGQALKLLRVNASATAVEFFQKAIASQLSELVDGPGAYANGKYLKSTASGWVWSDGFNVNQNNIGVKRSLGTSVTEPTTALAASRLNISSGIVVSETQTPVIVYITTMPSEGVGSKLYPWLFLPGKGTWGGVLGITVTSSMLFQLPPLNLTPDDVIDDPNVSIVNLDPVVDGDFVSKANESFWDFSDSDYQNGGQSYYFSYTDDGVLYYALFVGTPGTYGDGATLFTEDDFVDTTNSGVQPEIPESISVWVDGEYSNNQYVSKVINSQLYLFRSTSDNNTTEPLLRSNKEPWKSIIYGVTPIYNGEWSAGSYVTGNVVSKNGFAYYCFVDTDTDPEQLLPPYWFKLGIYTGTYNPSFPYSNGEVVAAAGNQVYVSNYDNNTYALNTGVVSKWEVVNGQLNTITFWGDSFTEGSGSTGNGNYPTQLSIMTGFNSDNQGIAGETSTQIKTRFMASPEKWGNATVFWVGYNNNSDPTTVKADIAEMVSKLGHDRYLVLEILRSTTDGDTFIPPLNSDLASIYKDRFVRLQDYLISLYNTAYSQDVIDYANNDTPWSERYDWLHLNNEGYYNVAKKISGYLGYLTGSEDITQRHINSKYIQVTDLNGTDRLPIAATEISYSESLNTGFINVYDGKTGTPKTLSIQYNNGSTLKLIENGGSIFSGNIGVYSSGTSRYLVRDMTTGEWKTSSPVGSGYVPYENSDGIFIGSPILTNGSNVSIGGDVSGYKFDVYGISASRGANNAVISGQANTTQGFIQFLNTDTSANGNGQIFTAQLQVGAGTISPTTNGEVAVFGGEIKIFDPTLPTSATTRIYVDTAIAASGDIKQNGNSFGGTMTIGTNDGFNLVLKRNNIAKVIIGESGVSFQDGVISGANNGGQLYFGNDSTVPMYAYRNLGDSTSAFRVRNDHASSTGNIADFSSNIGGTLAVRAGVRKDGRVYGSNAVAGNDYVTLSQSDRSVLNDSITTMPSAATLEASYPSVPLPYYVIAKNINSGASPTIFIKHSVGVWLFQPIALLT